MNVTNNELKSKVEKYHKLLRECKDTSQIECEIKELTNQYIENTNNQLNDIKQEKHSIEQKKVINEKITKKDYNNLIELYRKAFDIMKDIRKYKKYLREVK